jgi:hypothetical protein
MWALGITMLHLMLGRAPERTLGVVALEEEDTTTDGTESVHTTRSRASTTTTPPAATTVAAAAAGSGSPTARCSSEDVAAAAASSHRWLTHIFAQERREVAERGYSVQVIELAFSLLVRLPAARLNAQGLRDASLCLLGGDRAATYSIPAAPAVLTPVTSKRDLRPSATPPAAVPLQEAMSRANASHGEMSARSDTSHGREMQ